MSGHTQCEPHTQMDANRDHVFFTSMEIALAVLTGSRELQVVDSIEGLTWFLHFPTSGIPP